MRRPVREATASKEAGHRRRRAIPAKVFVGNLSFRTTKEELTQLLSAAGTVVDVYMPADRATGKPRGFAFVEFGSEAEAAEAIRQFNGRDVGGRTLKLNPADERPQRRPGPRTFGPPEVVGGPSFFAVEGRLSRPKGSRRGTRGRKRSL
jgi:RNA recognition motif-containing protein